LRQHPAASRSGECTSPLACIRSCVGCALIIQSIGLDPSGAVWTDGASNMSRPDPSGAIQIDAEHPSRNRKVVDFLRHRWDQ
jgi:hypothetical protein